MTALTAAVRLAVEQSEAAVTKSRRNAEVSRRLLATEIERRS